MLNHHPVLKSESFSHSSNPDSILDQKQDGASLPPSYPIKQQTLPPQIQSTTSTAAPHLLTKPLVKSILLSLASLDHALATFRTAFSEGAYPTLPQV